VTLLGVGGVGKTRVAIEVAHCLRGLFRDGAYFVDLAPVVDAGMVAATIAQHIGAVAPPAADARERLLAFLAPRNVLLVLDNFEHLLDAAPLVSEILAACAAVTALVTSRTPLSLHGEREREVPPLSVPDAADLFVQRVQDIQADFACTDENAPVIADICARLDGLPLALELAARRIKTYGSVAALLAALAPALPALVGGPRDAPARQRTMRAAIAWSYDLLRDDEQTLFRRLAVFGGGWALEAAEAVCADAVVEKDAVLDLLTELADKSLVQAPSVATPHPRYDLLETVREYGRERLDESGETATLRGRHRDWYLRLAETAEAYQSDAVWESWLDCLEADHNNLRAALAWSAAEPGGLASRLRLATALWRFWAVRGYLREGSSWLADAASLPSTISLAVRARALCAAGGLASYQASTPAQAAAAAEILNQSVTLFRQMGAEGCLGLAYALHNLGQLLFEAGDSAGGQAHLGKALALWRQLGDQRGAADTTTLLGFAALFDPTVESPIAHFGEGLRLFRAMDNKEGQANALLGLAYAHFFAGDYAAAEERIRDSLILSRDNGYPWGMATALVSYARLATATGRPERAARLYGAAEANREERNDPLPLVYQAKYEELAAPVRAAYRASWEQGRALTLDAAATEALGE